MILSEQLGIDGLIVHENTLILGSFLKKCVGKLKELMVEVIEKGENEIMPAKQDKKKKGKSGAKMPIELKDVMKFLEDKKILEYIVDEDQRDIFFKNLMPMVEQEYQIIKAEIENQKSNASTDMMADLSAKVEHLGMTLLLSSKSIKNLLEKSSDFCASEAEELALSVVTAFVDRVLMVNLKRFKVHVEQSWLARKKADECILI